MGKTANPMLRPAFHIMNYIHSILTGFLPEWAAISLWGLLGGAISMGLYSLLSSQGRIKEIKEQLKSLRLDLKDAQDDFDKTLSLSKKNITLSLSLLKTVLIPSLTSALPVLVIVLWMSVTQTPTQPVPGDILNITPTPLADVLTISDGKATIHLIDNQITLTWQPGSTMAVYEGGVRIWQLPQNMPLADSVSKRFWYNAVLPSEAGYIATDTSTEHLEFNLERKELFKVGPAWARTWELCYFIFVAIAALTVKFTFRIH